MAAAAFACGCAGAGQDDGCTGAECAEASSSGRGGAAQTSAGATDGGSSEGASTDGGSGGASDSGDAAPFSVLPPFGVAGTRWTYLSQLPTVPEPYEEQCTIEEVFTWPDGVGLGLSA